MSEQLDFIYLVYGLTLFALALTAGSMIRRRTNGAAWHFFCAFAIMDGLSVWLELLTPVLCEQSWFNVLRYTLLVGAFISLFEFGRKSILWSSSQKVGVWAYFPSLCVILLGVHLWPEDIWALICVNFGFPAGILAALALWQSVKYHNHSSPRWIAVVGPLALGLYALSIGFIIPSAHFWPVNHFNEGWIFAHTGIPIQAWRCLLAGVLTLSFWSEYSRWRARTYPTDYTWRLKYFRMFSGAVLGVMVVVGWGLVEHVEQHWRRDYERHLMSLSRGMAAVISTDEISQLGGTRADLENPHYQSLKTQCQLICEADQSFRYVYLVIQRQQQVIFLVDTEPKRLMGELGKPNAIPGDVYEQIPSEITEVFKTGKAQVSEPYKDEWGYFVSGFAPIISPYTDQVIAVIGVDTLGSQLASVIFFARLICLLLTGGAILLVLSFSVLWQREIEESQFRATSSVRMNRQQSALLAQSNSEHLTAGNIFMVARQVAQATAEVLGVERVDLWLKEKQGGLFRAEEMFRASSGSHKTGPATNLTEEGPFLKLLDEGRVILSSNFQLDGRFARVKEEWGAEALAVIVAPVRVSGGLVGWLSVIDTHRCRNWLTDEIRFVKEMSDQMVHALINDERKRAEEALRKAHDELEIRVRERTEALSKKNVELSREISERLRIEGEQRLLQDKMQQAQKLESLGLMAGGIAHDFNNILMTVLGNVELARLETPEGSPIYKYLEDIDKASCRAADLARQMLIYSGRGHSSIHGIDLNEMVRDMLSMLKVSLGKQTQLVYELEPELPVVDGDLTQLRQVLMNLVINAEEAIVKESGSITLRTGVIHYDRAQFCAMCLKEELAEGKYVFLDVIDTGNGMDEDTLKRIFDPFFTTKFTGRGLGLAAVLGIIKGHNGTIDVSSQKEKGTQFRIILPVGRRKLKEEQPAPYKNVQGWKGEGTVLLADDEPAIREVARRILERLGFTVLEACDGNEAVSIFKQQHDHIKCVLLDLTMPDLDGKEASVLIRQIEPTVKIILCSGYMVENIVHDFSDKEVDGFLQKPYKHDVFVSVLRKALDK